MARHAVGPRRTESLRQYVRATRIVVAVTVAVLNEVIERRQRERWSVLAQYALFDLVRAARLAWSSLLELAGLVPDGELGGEALAAGSAAVADTQRVASAIDDLLESSDGRTQLHRLISTLLDRDLATTRGETETAPRERRVGSRHAAASTRQSVRLGR
jgi:hypothetical protein